MKWKSYQVSPATPESHLWERDRVTTWRTTTTIERDKEMIKRTASPINISISISQYSYAFMWICIEKIFCFRLRVSPPSKFNNFGSFNHRILPCNRLPAGGFVVVAAVVTIRVAVLPAKQLAASASESSQTDLPMATGASIHLSLSHHRLLGRHGL